MSRSHDAFAAIDARQVYTTLTGETGKRAGKALQFRSPFRDDGDKPSFTVYADGYKDFGGSGESGGVIDLTARLMGTDHAAAREWLAQFAGGSAAAAAPRQHDQRTSESEPPSTGWQTIARAAAAAAAAYLWSGAPDAVRALDYLRTERHLTDETIRAAGLGFNPAWKELKYRESGDSDPIKLPPGITIPYDVSGAIWAIRVRAFGGASTQPKYLNLTGSRASGVLYGADRLAQHGGAALIVEGEFDALLAGQELDQVNAVTFGGASTAPSHIPARWRAALDTAERVYLALDSDQAGETAAARLGRALPHAVRLALPQGVKDVTELAQAGGDLRTWFDQQVNPIAAAAPIQRAEAAADARFYVDGVPDGVTSILLHVSEAAADVHETAQTAARVGLINPEKWTLQDLQSAADQMGVTVPTLARPIAALVDLGVFCKNRGNKDSLIVDDFAKNLSGGAPRVFYTLPPMADQRAAITSLARRKAHELAHPITGAGELPPALAEFTPIMVRTLIDAADDEAQIAAEIEAASADLYSTPDQEKQRRRAAANEKRLIAFFGRVVQDGYTSPIDPEWRRVHGFRAAYTRALKANRDEEIFNQGYALIGLWIGVTAQTVGKVLRLAAVQSERGHVEPITITAQPDRVIPEIRRHAGEHHAKPFAVRVTSGSGHSEQYPFTFDNARSAAERAHRDPGARFEVLYQMPNRQTLITDAVPTPQTRQAPAEARQHDEPRRTGETVPESRTFTPPCETGYTPEWVIGQLMLRLEKRGEWLVNRQTGETARIGGSVRQLIELVIGRRVRAVDPLMAEIASAGGIARVSA